MTYEEILQGMLDRVPSNVDKREGSVIFDAMAPCAYFLAQQHWQLENFIDMVFADTAEAEYLDKAVAPFGLVRKGAGKAVRKMAASTNVPVGTRWAINDLVYVVSAKLSDMEYEAECETAGDIGNQYSGSLTPISNVPGVTAELTDIVMQGTDAESDSALRERFYAKVRLPATSGNAYHYQQWAMEVPGVGAAKVFPLDDGPGTVAILVVGDDKKISEALPAVVAEHIETVRPIGATVTVSSPSGKEVSASADVLLDGSKTIEEINASFAMALESFLAETVFDTYRISYAKVGSLLLDVPGVEDFNNLLLNSTVGNVPIGEKEVPILGTAVLTEVSILGID